jgi:hypothetical protein
VFDLVDSGVEKGHSLPISSLPYKKKRNQELSKEQKQYNQRNMLKKEYSIREHTICRLKKYRILAQMCLGIN